MTPVKSNVISGGVDADTVFGEAMGRVGEGGGDFVAVVMGVEGAVEEGIPEELMDWLCSAVTIGEGFVASGGTAGGD